MSELRDQLEAEVKRIIDEPDGPLPEFPIRPSEIETEGVFDQSLLDSAGYTLPPDEPFMDDPLKAVVGMMRDLKDMAPQFMPAPMVYDPPPSEHKIRIFRLNDQSDLPQIELTIEKFLNDGYRGYPTTCNDFLIMDFSRRKETEEDGKQQS